MLCFPWKDPTDDDFEPTIKKLSDAKGHLEMTDTDKFSKDVLDSNDGKKSCDFSQLAVLTIQIPERSCSSKGAYWNFLFFLTSISTKEL